MYAIKIVPTKKRPYRADRVLRVKNGVINFFLHTINGHPAGANPHAALRQSEK